MQHIHRHMYGMIQPELLLCAEQGKTLLHVLILSYNVFISLIRFLFLVQNETENNAWRYAKKNIRHQYCYTSMILESNFTNRKHCLILTSITHADGSNCLE